MAKNITYLLGAGASANALPVINEIDGKLENFKNIIKDFIDEKRRNPLTNNLNPAADEFFGEISWLIDNTKNHLTIDAFARKLFAKDSSHSDLRSLKRVLSTYFLFEQIKTNQNESLRKDEKGNTQFKQTPDKRYDGLISTLISDVINNNQLAGNVKIISWNYDSQFEQAYKEFWDFKHLYQTHEPLQVIPGKWLVENGGVQEIDFSKFKKIQQH